MRVHLLAGCADKDDVSSQASAREPPPAPQGSPPALRSPFPEHPRLAGSFWGSCPPMAPRGNTQPSGGGEAAASAAVGRKDWLRRQQMRTGCCTMCKSSASNQRRLEGRNGKKMIKTIPFLKNNKKKKPWEKAA